MSSSKSYDDVAYRSRAIPATDPQVMSTVANLYGLEVADPADCDVLEIGCGDGGNLVSLAAAYPGVRTVGYDPARRTIARGRESIERTGLTNVALYDDESDVNLDESADYVFAHGVLTWVNEDVQEAVIASAARAARPGALVNFSYRALPYAYYELAARDAARFAIRLERERAAERGQQLSWLDELAIARDRVKWIGTLTGTEPHRQVMQFKAETWEEAQDWHLWHDDLSDDLFPFRAADVAARAAAHGLTYVGELMPHDMWQLRLGEPVKEQIRQLAGPSAIHQRQVADDLIGGGFHSSLFVKGEAAPHLEPEARGQALYVRQYVHNKERGALDSDREHAGIAQVVREHHPSPVLSSQIAEELGQDQETIDRELLRLHALELVRVTTCPPNAPAPVGRFPRLATAAREDIVQGDDIVTTRFHTPMAVDLTARRALFLLCDGTRDRAELRRDLPLKAEELGLTANLGGVFSDLDGVLVEAALAGLLEEPLADDTTP